jgi:hypothetical protein
MGEACEKMLIMGDKTEQREVGNGIPPIPLDFLP